MHTMRKFVGTLSYHIFRVLLKTHGRSHKRMNTQAGAHTRIATNGCTSRRMDTQQQERDRKPRRRRLTGVIKKLLWTTHINATHVIKQKQAIIPSIIQSITLSSHEVRLMHRPMQSVRVSDSVACWTAPLQLLYGHLTSPYKLPFIIIIINTIIIVVVSL